MIDDSGGSYPNNDQKQSAELTKLVEMMKTAHVHEQCRKCQRSQTFFRMNLVDSWEIKKGARILEIGCGQGDTTAVLSRVVGSEGQIVGVDIAPPTYGCPVNLGDSIGYLLNEQKKDPDMGKISVHFNTNLGDKSGVEFLEKITGGEKDFFDCVILSLCSWYFDSEEMLVGLMSNVLPYAKQFCYAEYSCIPRHVNQVPHLMSVMIQLQLASVSENWKHNVRTLNTETSIVNISSSAGWELKKDDIKYVDNDAICSATGARPLDDGTWEVGAVTSDDVDLFAGIKKTYEKDGVTYEVPDKLLHSVRLEIDNLKSLVKGLEHIGTLPVFTFKCSKKAKE
eukprot:Nk52_evm1s2085 gene=Nk52_evmTU1s2085